MADIFDNEEIDKDTVEEEELYQLFPENYNLLTEKAVSLKKSYINKLHGTKSLKLAVSVSDGSIEVYELNNSSLDQVCRLSGHRGAVGGVVFSPREDHLLYSAGQHGVVKLWDTRASGSCVQEYKEEEDKEIKPFECLDVSCNGRVICAGSQLVKDDAFLVFWDQKMPKPLGGYWNSHTEDITQVKFHKEKPETLATGSSDGLMNIFNITEQTEDDALIYSLNVENSVEKLSWLDDKVAAVITQSNDLQTWDTEAGDMLRSYSRDKVAKSIKRSKHDDCYLVDAFTAQDGSHVLLAGSYGGDGSCLRSVSLGDKKLRARTALRGNTQTVSCSWYQQDKDILVTTGEGGVISVWARPPSPAPAPAAPAVEKLTIRESKKGAHRHKPY
ncbi:WD repeat-containing protein 89 [Plutella xylostella]|uniref:WD repeat-containing protein 89 n=1 Tax=Plutella xylostella TaxID=51655 RepID=UPI00203303FC|nr:WD repeat-containing protein 89 [Plutella xylostella]